MSSYATAQSPPGWEKREEPHNFLRYYSIGPDIYSAGVDVFSQNVRGRAGVWEFLYINPPHNVARAVVLFFAGSRARALFVLPDCSNQWWWPTYVTPYITWQYTLGTSHTEYRCKLKGWLPTTRNRVLTAYVLDFRHRARGRTSHNGQGQDGELV